MHAEFQDLQQAVRELPGQMKRPARRQDFITGSGSWKVNRSQRAESALHRNTVSRKMSSVSSVNMMAETAPPSSIESAIVHMVNGLVKKIEVFDSYTMASEWNQDMVIYQTLNEYSASGIYDQSGLGMNMFLKIREYLVNEETFFF